MRKPPLAIFALVSITALAACRKEPKSHAPPARPRPHVLAVVPRIPGSAITDTTGSEDAERLSLTVQYPYDSVLRFYRVMLPATGWHLTSDVADTAQASLLAVKDSFSVWVHINRLGRLAADYTLIAGLGQAETPKR